MIKKKETAENSRVVSGHSKSIVEAKKRTFVEYLHKYGTNFSYIKSEGPFENLSEDELMGMYEDYMDFKGQFLNEFEEESIINKIEKITERIILDKKASLSKGVLYKALITRDGKRKIQTVADLRTSDFRLPFLLKDYELRLKQQLSYVYELYSALLESGGIEEEFFDDNLYYFVDSLKYRGEASQDEELPDKDECLNQKYDQNSIKAEGTLIYDNLNKWPPVKADILDFKAEPPNGNLNDAKLTTNKSNKICSGKYNKKGAPDGICKDKSNNKTSQGAIGEDRTLEKKSIEEKKSEVVPFLSSESLSEASSHIAIPSKKDESRLCIATAEASDKEKNESVDDDFIVLESIKSNSIDTSDKDIVSCNINTNNVDNQVTEGNDFNLMVFKTDSHCSSDSVPQAENSNVSTPLISSVAVVGPKISLESSSPNEKDSSQKLDLLDKTDAVIIQDDKKTKPKKQESYASGCGGVSLKSDILNKYNDYLEDFSKEYNGQSAKKIKLEDFGGLGLEKIHNTDSKVVTDESLNYTSFQDSAKTEFKERIELKDKTEDDSIHVKNVAEFNVESSRKRHGNRVAVLVRPPTAISNANLNTEMKIKDFILSSGLQSANKTQGSVEVNQESAKNEQKALNKIQEFVEVSQEFTKNEMGFNNKNPNSEKMADNPAEDFFSKYLQQSRF